MKRKPILIGGVKIGGNSPVVIQTMTKTDTRNVSGVLKEVRQVFRAGAELVRVAIPDKDSLQAFGEITKTSPLPLIADVHFSTELALGAVNAGAAKLRINPGNITSKKDLRKIAATANSHGIPIRIGINSGSLPPGIIKRFGHPTPQAMIEALNEAVKMFEDFEFTDLVIAAKSSDVKTTIEVYRMMAERFIYPQHLGVTEAGLPFEGAIRSTAAMAPLLLEGIGDTIRISLTGPAVKEVEACWELLRSLGLRDRGIKFISCPGCGRTEVDIEKLAKEVKKKLGRLEQGQTRSHSVSVAVMGCVVNGPGEAKEADYGIAGGKGQGIIFRKGKVVKTVAEDRLVEELVGIIEKDFK